MKSSLTTSLAAVAAAALLTTSVWAQPPGGGRPGRFNPLMQVFDADGDGALSAAEVAAATEKLKTLDGDGDGQVSGAELLAALPARQGRTGRGGAGQGQRGPGRPPQTAAAGELQKQSLAKNDVERKILATIAQMQAGPGFANVSNTDGRLLRLLAETIDAQRIVEIGTSTGESAVWFALALKATGGQISTHEIDDGRAAVATENFRKAGVDDIVTLVMGDAHQTVARYMDPADPLFIDASQGEAIDILFLDADKEGYVDYLEQLLPLVRPGGLVIAHNMNTRQADRRFVTAITEDPQLETLILLKEGTGVGVTLKKR